MNTKMDKNYITTAFAERLRSSLINAGYHSSRTNSGVNILKFANRIQYSPQICRKYLRGEAIPEPQKICEIAELLQISPGWLMFGECHAEQEHETGKITISKNLLHHLFIHIAELCAPIQSAQYLPKLWLELTEDIQELSISEDQSKKIIDLALASLKHLKKESIHE